MQVALGILNRTGYSEVTTVVDGQQAMDELHRRGGADAFDIILTDLHMPHKVPSPLRHHGYPICFFGDSPQSVLHMVPMQMPANESFCCLLSLVTSCGIAHIHFVIMFGVWYSKMLCCSSVYKSTASAVSPAIALLQLSVGVQDTLLLLCLH